MNGVLNVYKEKDYTSHDVVAVLRGITHFKKIGHTGTLDPAAEGVLPVCFGSATKLCDFLTDQTKEYRAVMLLGRTSDTYDADGVMLTETSCADLEEAKIMQVIASFSPGYEQIPPMYSAKKVNGKKLYELAREGVMIERKPVYVELQKIAVTSIDLPRVTMEITCSKGTYIRSLCHDIGQKLGCGALMEHLVRCRVSDFTIDTALQLSQIEEKMRNGQLEECLRPVDDVLRAYPAVTGSERAEILLKNGNKLPVGLANRIVSDAEKVRVYLHNGKFVGLYVYREREALYQPVRIFPME